MGRDQLWAEATYRYRASRGQDDRWWLTPAEQELANEVARAVRAPSPVDGDAGGLAGWATDGASDDGGAAGDGPEEGPRGREGRGRKGLGEHHAEAGLPQCARPFGEPPHAGVGARVT